MCVKSNKEEKGCELLMLILPNKHREESRTHEIIQDRETNILFGADGN